jgi:hypothetical protein
VRVIWLVEFKGNLRCEVIVPKPSLGAILSLRPPVAYLAMRC